MEPGDAALLAGRFWVRTCSASPRGAELDVRLKGPGWYWVDESDGAFSVRQQVPFDLGIDVSCRIRAGISGGVLSLWFEPTRDPTVSLQTRRDVDVHSRNALGTMLRLLPFSSVSARATGKFSSAAEALLRSKLLSGATFTYDVTSGQADGALDHLVAGATPAHAFSNQPAWVVNDRLLLEATSAHVVGPIEPGPARLDVSIERGAGLEYRALCAEDMSASFDAVASGNVERIPARAVVARGDVAGPGVHSRGVRVEGCRYYLVVSSSNSSQTVAALRVRS